MVKAGQNTITFLRMMRTCCKHNLRGCGVKKFVYAGSGDFLLRHAKWYTPQPYPRTMWRGAPRSCFANAIGLATLVPELRYVEGYAEWEYAFPVHHAWCVDDNGCVYDPTWRDGQSYYGVEFRVERADDAAWDGDGTVLDDVKRGHPLFRQCWRGEDWKRVWPQSARLDLIRRDLSHCGKGFPASKQLSVGRTA